MTDPTELQPACPNCGIKFRLPDPFCIYCGSDALTGEPWQPEGGVEAVKELLERIEEQGSFEGVSVDEIANLVRFHAYGIGAAEARLAVAALRGLGCGDPNTCPPGDRGVERAIQDEVGVVGWQVDRFGRAVTALLECCAAEGISEEEFELRFADLIGFAWGDFTAYSGVDTPATLEEVLVRRVRCFLARVGAHVPATWEPEDKAFRLSFNGLVFQALPASALRWVDWPLGTDDLLGGPDGPDGSLVVGLVPAQWRRFGDVALAPPAYVFVYEQTDPSAGLDLEGAGPVADAADDGAALDSLRAGYEATMCARYGGPVAVRVTEVGGRPAVRATAYLAGKGEGGDGVAFDPEAESDVELLKRADVMEHVWVHTGGRIWHLQAWAPAWWAPQYLRTVGEVIAGGFACAAPADPPAAPADSSAAPADSPAPPAVPSHAHDRGKGA